MNGCALHEAWVHRERLGTRDIRDRFPIHSSIAVMQRITLGQDTWKKDEKKGDCGGDSVLCVVCVCCVPKAIGRDDEVMLREENASRSFPAVGLELVHGPQAEAVQSRHLLPIPSIQCCWPGARLSPQTSGVLGPFPTL